jgi:hypothetical protein
LKAGEPATMAPLEMKVVDMGMKADLNRMSSS